MSDPFAEQRKFFAAVSQPCPLPIGTRIEVTGVMPNDPDPLPVGSRGTVAEGSTGAQLHVDWDNGRTLMLLVGRDPYRVVEP